MDLGFIGFVVVVLLFVGFILWAVQNAPFIDGQMKVIIRYILLVLVGLWLIFYVLAPLLTGAGPVLAPPWRHR